MRNKTKHKTKQILLNNVLLRSDSLYDELRKCQCYCFQPEKLVILNVSRCNRLKGSGVTQVTQPIKYWDKHSLLPFYFILE